MKVTILAVTEEPLRLGSWLGAGQTRVRLHSPNSSERTIQLNGRMLNILLPDQVFDIPVHSGFLGFPWTELNGFSHDVPGTLALIQDKTREDLVLRKRRIEHALDDPHSASAYAEALRYLQEADDDLDFALTIAWHAGNPIRGRSDLAIQILEPLVAKHRNYKLYCGFASYLNNVGNTEMSLRYLTAAVEMSPTETEAYYMLGHTFRKAGRREESLAAFKKLIEISPSQEALVRPYM
ncbi:MAG: tetratricopeptide repeat protein [Nitrospira sp.]|nr:tetratricopeptide repeat protein [Nitrospira sp.]